MYVNISAPDPRPSGVSSEQAVELCRDWMIYLGATETLSTEDNTRGGYDLHSRRYLGWIFNRHGNLAPSAVERASAAAAADGRLAIVFVRGGVAPDAQRLADERGVALFCFRAVDGSLEGANALGYQLRESGLRA